MNKFARALYPHKELYPRKEKVYVSVTSEIDTTGFMHPKKLEWTNGRMYNIEEVRDFRPADTIGMGYSGDCYTVVIKGKEKRLFFEHSPFPPRFGRWFVEVIAG